MVLQQRSFWTRDQNDSTRVGHLPCKSPTQVQSPSISFGPPDCRAGNYPEHYLVCLQIPSLPKKGSVFEKTNIILHEKGSQEK